MNNEVEILGDSVSTEETVKKNCTIQQSKIKLFWNKGYTGKGIKVGVVDTGLQLDHEMYNGKIIAGQNFSNDGTDSSNLSSTHYHGTAVTSLICGDYINFQAYGIAPDCQIVIGKAMNNAGKGSSTAIANAITYCVQQGVDIINCSIGCPDDTSDLRNAVNLAVSNGISIVCASGNDGHNDTDGSVREVRYPSAYGESICVGAMDSDFKIADFSNSNEFVDVVAQGVDVVCAYPENNYAIISGTSFATPIISGILALLKQKFRVDFQRDPAESELFGMLLRYTREIKGVSRQCQGWGYADLSIKREKRL